MLGYLNWPYGHGVDLVGATERLKDVRSAYNDTREMERVVERYGVDYVYLGEAERNLPNAESTVESAAFLEKVYDGRGAEVYRVER